MATAMMWRTSTPGWICGAFTDGRLLMGARGRARAVFAGLLRVAVHLGALLPLTWLVYAVPRGTLGGDPVQALIHFFGLGALRLLLLALLVSPLVKVLRFSPLLRLRRP